MSFQRFNGLGKPKSFNCKGDYIWRGKDGKITSKSREEFPKKDRYELGYDDIKCTEISYIYDNETDKSFQYPGVVKLLNKLVTETEYLEKQRDYWKSKYDEVAETFEIPDYYRIPSTCDDCTFLGNNGICGYCKFTCECYDGKDDLVDGNVLRNCPFHRNDRLLENCRAKYRRLDLELLQKIRQVGDLVKRIKQLEKENEEFREEINAKNCHKCMNYCQDKASDYCLVDEREPTYFPFPFGWNYKIEAEKCQYYER